MLPSTRPLSPQWQRLNLGHDPPDERPTGRTEREPQREITPLCQAAGQDQVCKIGARNEKHADRGPEERGMGGFERSGFGCERPEIVREWNPPGAIRRGEARCEGRE